MSRTRAVLFDLDGTFADTAPDLTYALNVMRAARGLPPCSIENTRPVTSTGGRGMLRVGFGMTPEHPDYVKMRAEFIEIYAQNLCRETMLFAGMRTIAVRYGYLNGGDPDAWGADAVVDCPQDVLGHV